MMLLGGYQGDAIRNITGTFVVDDNARDHSGAFAYGGDLPYQNSGAKGTGKLVLFNASRVVPTAAENRPKSASLHCYIYTY